MHDYKRKVGNFTVEKSIKNHLDYKLREGKTEFTSWQEKRKESVKEIKRKTYCKMKAINPQISVFTLTINRLLH